MIWQLPYKLKLLRSYVKIGHNLETLLHELVTVECGHLLDSFHLYISSRLIITRVHELLIIVMLIVTNITKYVLAESLVM